MKRLTGKRHFRQFIILSLVAMMSCSLFMSCKEKDKEPETENDVSAENETEQSDDEVYDFYNPVDDNALWVDSALIRAEEERIAGELAEMEETLEEAQVEAEVDEEAVPVEKIISGKKDEMRFYEYNDEILSPQYTEEGFSIVHSSKENTVRCFYDLKYHLIKKEEWKIKSASDAKKLKTELFEYSEDNGKILAKEIRTDKESQYIIYNESSLPVSLQKSAITEEEEYLVMERDWIYDEKNRVIKDVQTEYKYAEDDEGEDETFIRKYEYIYSDASETPDLKYYENDILKMQKIQNLEKGKYITWIYFDDSLSVKTYYEDEVRVRDEYYNKGKLFRSRTYEQDVKK